MLDDKVETIFALADGVDTITGVQNRIEEVFSNDKEGVVFSTVHRAKGLESDNVYILKPELFPHPMAKQDWELQQERNITYVAYTRAKQRLAFVGQVPQVYIEDRMWDAEEVTTNQILEYEETLPENPIHEAAVLEQLEEDEAKSVVILEVVDQNGKQYQEWADDKIVIVPQKEIPECPF